MYANSNKHILNSYDIKFDKLKKISQDTLNTKNYGST